MDSVMEDEKTVYHDRPVTVKLAEVDNHGSTEHHLTVRVGSTVMRLHIFGSGSRHHAKAAYDKLVKELDEG